MSTLNFNLTTPSGRSWLVSMVERMNKMLASETAQKGIDTVIMLSALAIITGVSFASTTGGTAAGSAEVGGIATWLKDMTEGSMGTVFALGTLAVGLATGIVRQTLMPVAVAVGMAATAKWGPGILVGITGTVI